MHDKMTLKNMALDKGLSRRGFNGRNVSRMRKQDFIDFILYKDRIDQGLDISPSLEDDMINIFQELIMDDSFQPIIHIMGALGGLQSGNIHVFGRSNSYAQKEPSLDERVPNEEDESVPNLAIQELITSQKMCDTDCECDVCQKNNDIIKENLKVKNNLQDLETKITCVVCQSNVRNVIFKPCHHLATCISCSKNSMLNFCPLCRKKFESAIRVFC
jgi:hypothetical protein